MSARKLRIALYSPGIVGLGHLRRNLVIAQTLACSPMQPIALMVTEAREAGIYVTEMPPRMDCLTLPGLSKSRDGNCKPRYLDLELDEMIKLRGKTIRAALKEFEPDVLIVDNLPRGAYRELDPTLELLRETGRTRCVLGLRDVLDEPQAVQRDWQRWENERAILEHYDAIWVYGDQTIYDMRAEYSFASEGAAKARFTGYLDQRVRLAFTGVDNVDPLGALGLPPGRMVLCLVGGGQDGERLAETFARATLPADTNGVILTGNLDIAHLNFAIHRITQ